MPKKSTQHLKPANILLEKHMRELGLAFVAELRFSFARKWKADYALMEQHVLIEIEGSVYQQGRHTRGKGFEEDCVKYNTATMLGYRVLRFSTGQVLRGEAKKFLQEWLGKG